jgi:hypothetical protein
MASSKPVTWLITDIINWYKSKELVINDTFQRHSVWTPQAKTLLIDTILNELPLPKIFIRTKIDAKQQKTIKEIVDGQQRIRSIVEFANNEFALNNKSENYSGKYYKNLSTEMQEAFLGFTITAEQLLNATDDDVIDIFARLNSYTVSLNAAEKRHASYQTELKFFIRRMSVKYRWFIEKYKIFSLTQRFRMADDEFFAEIVRLIMTGINDGGSEKITKFYDVTNDQIFDGKKQKEIEGILEKLIKFLDEIIADILKGLLGKHYQIYSLCAAYLYINQLIPKILSFPKYNKLAYKDIITNNLLSLEKELIDKSSSEFTKASSSSTQRMANRLIRTKHFLNAIGNK